MRCLTRTAFALLLLAASAADATPPGEYSSPAAFPSRGAINLGIVPDGNYAAPTLDPLYHLYTDDTNNASIGAAGTAPIAVTVGTPYAAGRTLQFNCTTGGNITFTEAGASVIWNVGVGTTEIAHVTTAVTSLGSAAVCPQIYVHY